MFRQDWTKASGLARGFWCERSNALPPAEIALGSRLWPWCELRFGSLHLPKSRQHALEARIERIGNIAPLFQRREQHPCGLDGREPISARLAAQFAIARRPPGSEN